MEAMIRKIRINNHLLRFEVQVTQINRGFFFTHVRRMMFSNILQQSQVDGMNAILDGWEAKYTADDDRWLAYALATTYHETDQHMQPINEYGKGRGMPYGKADPNRAGLLRPWLCAINVGAQLRNRVGSVGDRLRSSSRSGARARQRDKHYVPRHVQGFVHGQVVQ